MPTIKRHISKPWLIVALLSGWSLFFAACMTAQRTVVAPAKIAGAQYVGSKQCASCHTEIAAKFATASHAMLAADAGATEGTSCESCHGAGSLHVKAGGGPGTIFNPKKSPEGCFQCHVDKRGQFSLPNSHPVMAGKVSCSDCHDPHAGSAIKGKGAATLEGENDTCTKCHTAQKGPFIFKHQGIREGCTACHNPHGSVNAKMLVARDANLCNRCHLERPAAHGNGTIMIGGEDHRSRLQNGNCWVAGCHEAVHGSNASKALRY